MPDVMHPDIIGQYNAVNGQLRDVQQDALNWIVSSLPYINYTRDVVKQQLTPTIDSYSIIIVNKRGKIKGHFVVSYAGHVTYWTTPLSASASRSFVSPLAAVQFALKLVG